MRNITDLGSFAVKNDGSEDFKKFVLEPLNEIRRKSIKFMWGGHTLYSYYGINNDKETEYWFLSQFITVPILTVQQVKDHLLSGVRPGEVEKKQEEKSEVDELAPEEKELLHWWRDARKCVKSGKFSIADERLQKCKDILGDANDYV